MCVRRRKSEFPATICLRRCRVFVPELCACLSVYTQHLSFMCLFVFLCDTSYPRPFILFYLLYSRITVLLLLNYIFSSPPTSLSRRVVQQTGRSFFIRSAVTGALQVPCSHPALVSSSSTVNPEWASAPIILFCERPGSLLRDKQTPMCKNL